VGDGGVGGEGVVGGAVEEEVADLGEAWGVGGRSGNAELGGEAFAAADVVEAVEALGVGVGGLEGDPGAGGDGGEGKALEDERGDLIATRRGAGMRDVGAAALGFEGGGAGDF